jgi:hypothetical protein
MSWGKMIMNKKSPFEPFANNLTSQFGEDGIINEIFIRLGVKNKLCVEFGAWDGIHCSNTWNLWHNNDWDAILIEADTKKFSDLQNNAKNYPKVKVINKYVTCEGENCLESILDNLNVPREFELLSIDIDGDDYYIFESIAKYLPKLIVIEYNPTIPPHMSIIQNKGEYFGSSAMAIIELAKRKGYQLVHISDTNLFLIHQDYFPLLNIEQQNLLEIFPMKYVNYLFSSYDGELFVSNNFTYGVKKHTKKLHFFKKFSIQKDFVSNKFPFITDDKTQKILINHQIKPNE